MGEISKRTAWVRLAQKLNGKGWHRDKMGKVKIKPTWKR